VSEADPRDGLLLPDCAERDVERRFHELTKKYSFRLFLRNAGNLRDKPDLVLNLMLCLKDWLDGKGLAEEGSPQRSQP
jgi:hypothetical protein